MPSRNVSRPVQKAKPDPDYAHKPMLGPSFGVVYANELAAPEMKNPLPYFPVGSMIVREKNRTLTAKTPDVVIAMVKRKKGFSTETGDWEFFVLRGLDLNVISRRTKSSCAECHIQAKKSDWVFRDYMKLD